MADSVFTTADRPTARESVVARSGRFTRVAAGALSVGVICASVAACRPGGAPEPGSRLRVADIRLDRETERLVAQVPRNGTLQSILSAHRVKPEQGTALLDAIKHVFDLRGLKAHHPYELELTLDGFLREFRYQIDRDKFLHVLGTKPQPDAPEKAPDFKVEVVPYRKETGLVSVRGTIDKEHPSLVSAMNASGENIMLAISLAEIFGGDIDFAHDLQPGDQFELVFEQVMREGARAGYGEILAASFTNSGKTYQAIRYEVPGGKPAYYDEQGRSLHRFFLASPLKFEPRVTSAFSYRRLHPVLGIRRPHLGVDFGAPTGAPVISVAEATVVSAARTRGGGNTVTLRHAGGYESQYLHLSAFAPGLRAGQRIGQGEVIGKVGSTGLATGPHLHYVLKKNGEHINPLAEHKKHPPGEPIPPAQLATFDARRDDLRGRFVSASQGRVDTAVASATPAIATPAAAPAAPVTAASSTGETQ